MTIKKIAIFGGTGFAGRNIMNEAAGRGHEIRSYSRERVYDGSTKDTVSFQVGSLYDPEVVADAFSWADVAAVAIPGRDVGDGALVDAVPMLVQQAAAHDVRVGFVGGAGSLLVSEDGPRLLDGPDFPSAFVPEASAHAAVLDALRASGDSEHWFYLSPAPVFGAAVPGVALGNYRVGGDVLLPPDESGNLEISGADLALAFVDEIDTPHHTGQRFSVAH